MRRVWFILATAVLLSAAAVPAFAFGSRDDAEPASAKALGPADKSVDASADKPADKQAAPGADAADWNAVRQGDSVELSGKIRLVGSEAANSLVLTDAADKDWYVDEPERGLLAGKEQRSVKLSAVVRLDEVKFANGKRLDDKRVLTSIKVLE